MLNLRMNKTVEHGAVLVESTLALPIFLLIIGATIAFSYAIIQSMLYSDSVKVAARAGAGHIGTCQEAQEKAKNKVRDYLSKFNLSSSAIDTEVVSNSYSGSGSGGSGGAHGSHSIKGLKVRVKARLGWLFPTEFSATIPLEGGSGAGGAC